MAQGDLTMFEEALAYMLDGGWEAADNIKVALITNSPAPAASAAAPALTSGGTTNYTEVAAGGNYAAGGAAVCTWGTFVSEAGGTVTGKDDSASVSWSQHASNPSGAYYALVYNDDQSNLAICYIDLGGTTDLTAGDLTITWNGSGIFTIS